MTGPDAAVLVLDGLLTVEALAALTSIVDGLDLEAQEYGRAVLARRGLRVDPPLDAWAPIGLNPRSRVYGYGMGAAFSEHEDEPWRPDPLTRSFLTVLVYLPCGGCVGGATVVDGTVVPVVDGRIVIFDHGLLHEGRPVERGRKLVLRTDVVCSARSGPA